MPKCQPNNEETSRQGRRRVREINSRSPKLYSILLRASTVPTKGTTRRRIGQRFHTPKSKFRQKISIHTCIHTCKQQTSSQLRVHTPQPRHPGRIDSYHIAQHHIASHCMRCFDSTPAPSFHAPSTAPHHILVIAPQWASTRAKQNGARKAWDPRIGILKRVITHIHAPTRSTTSMFYTRPRSRPLPWQASAAPDRSAELLSPLPMHWESGTRRLFLYSDPDGALVGVRWHCRHSLCGLMRRRLC